MDWKKYDKLVRQFAQGLNCEIEEENIHALSQTIQLLTFFEKDLINYELKHSKPITSIGSQMKLESEKGENDYSIISRQNLFFRPKLEIKVGHLDLVIQDRLRQVQKRIGEFEWRTNGTLKFTARVIDLDLETLHLIRDIHLSLKE